MSPLAEIRPLGPDDSIAELTVLLHRAYAVLGAMGLNYTAVDQSEAVTLRRTRVGPCYVAVAGTRLLGTIVFESAAKTRGSPWLARPEVSSLHQFAVLPEYQRTGLGGRLMDVVERLAAASGAEEIALDTAEPAAHLIRYYTKRGYRFIEFAQWPEKVYRTVIMSKRVAPESGA